jgi:glutamate synthase (NADPH/NADH) small chain
MGKITGFLEYERSDRHYEPVEQRIRHWREFVLPLPEGQTRTQAARCMDCGIPYCHTGCPVNNQIPDWNDLVYRDNWQEAARNLHSTNNFPEVTGRVCPAPCEASCTLNLDDNPVTIKTIECAIADRAFEQGWIVPEPPACKTGRTVAIVGSGPAGLACAQQLARAGHDVQVYEKLARAGGLLRYGIPDFKMEKHTIDARVAQMEAEGVTFHYGAQVGVSVTAQSLLDGCDALVLAGGAEKPRDLPIPGRALNGIHFAMEFLPQQNRRVSGEADDGSAAIVAAGKHVVVIGGGDTGSDCIGTAIRQGARSVVNFEIMPAPPLAENKLLTWPEWPLKLRTSSSHEEGVERDFAVLTTAFSGEGGRVKKLHCVRVDDRIKPIAGSELEIAADLVLLAMGFVHPVHEGMIQSLGLALDARGNVRADMLAYAASHPKVFACGDMRRGQSLVVWAIREGRQCAHAVDKFLMGETMLPRSGRLSSPPNDSAAACAASRP